MTVGHGSSESVLNTNFDFYILNGNRKSRLSIISNENCTFVSKSFRVNFGNCKQERALTIQCFSIFNCISMLLGQRHCNFTKIFFNNNNIITKLW